MRTCPFNYVPLYIRAKELFLQMMELLHILMKFLPQELRQLQVMKESNMQDLLQQDKL